MMFNAAIEAMSDESKPERDDMSEEDLVDILIMIPSFTANWMAPFAVEWMV
jgi:hypothetical protein